MTVLATALTLYAGTFVLEDSTTIAGGLLIYEGRVSFLAAFIALSLGITCGDTALFGLGWLAGSWKPLRRFVGEARLESSHGWTRSHLVRTLAIARLLPAARTPIYLAAGIVHAPVRRYVTTTLFASMAYVFVLLRLTMFLGETIGARFDTYRWLLLAIPVCLFLVRTAREKLAPPHANQSKTTPGPSQTPRSRPPKEPAL